MKTIIAFFAGILGFNTIKASEVDCTRFLAAIATVENTTGRGRNGEIGIYQFRESTWKQHSKEPFKWAFGHNETQIHERERVAQAHFLWLQKNLKEPTVWRMALAWNAGIGAVNRSKFSESNFEYASRVRNVYLEGLQ